MKQHRSQVAIVVANLYNGTGRIVGRRHDFVRREDGVRRVMFRQLTVLAVLAAWLGSGWLSTSWGQERKGRFERRGGRGQAAAPRDEHGWLSHLGDAKEQAKATGKPIMVVIRCVP